MEYEIVLDTETTGFEPTEGHKLVEIGCVELKNRLPTGRVFHKYINPEREVPEPAFKVHGLNYEFLKDYPKFDAVADEFLEFIDGKRLIIHNADFDVKFLNYELQRSGNKKLKDDLVFCTLKFARKKFPGMQNSLDALCKRFNVDNSHREKHGALLDSEILAEVYLELMGGKQVTFELDKNADNVKADAKSGINLNPIKVNRAAERIASRNFEIDPEELKLHEEFISKMKNPIWLKTNEQ